MNIRFIMPAFVSSARIVYTCQQANKIGDRWIRRSGS